MGRNMSLSGIYPITSDAFMERPDHEEIIAEIAGAGIAMLQFRPRHGAPNKALGQARRLLAICREHAVPLIVNDDIGLCALAGADGVHLGAGDASIASARAALGPEAIIGATCHASLELARAAWNNGADYVAFGRFFSSTGKPQAPPAELDLLRKARAALDIPIAAIGGIDRGNARQPLLAGADLLAMIHGIFGTPDPATAARDLVGLHARHRMAWRSPRCR